MNKPNKLKERKMTDLEILKELEKELGVEFKEIDFSEVNFKKITLTYPTIPTFISQNNNIVGLVIFNCDLSNLNLIGKLINLQFLNLAKNKITDISALKNLTNLKKLSLHQISINDISALKNLTNLKKLSLHQISINDISALKNLTNLKELSLSEISITDISALKNLTNLKELSLSEISITDISAFKNLTNLETLNLYDISITDISVIKNLTNLRVLNLSENQITDISVLENLINLTRIDLSFNQIINISALENLINLTNLDLGDNQIKDILSLRNLINITNINLSNNEITDISALKNLTNLTILELTNNLITDISALKNLKNIIDISLAENQINEIYSLRYLTDITDIYLYNNQITDISPIEHLFKEYTHIEYKENPLKFPPIEICNLGREAIIEYFKQAEEGTSILREAKLIIIGEAGSGKTTFARKIENPDAEMPKNEETTLGIDIYNWNFCKNGDKNSKDFNIKLWDFGGQDIYHGTHQFFFSKNSLYVLLSDNRKQNTDFNHWLNTVEQLSGEESPLVILLNEKEKHTHDIDETGLRNRFGKIIKEIHSCNLSYSEKIPKLQEIIQKHICELPHIDYRLPKSWVNIRKDLAQLKKNFISYERFREICNDNGITKPKVIEIISRLFNNIGVFTHFTDETSSLKDIIFLNSDWLTKTVYLLLNHKIAKDEKGRINKEQIKSIWKSDELYFDLDKFIELLKKFSLMYEINESEEYIVPERLPNNQPYENWEYANKDGVYKFQYVFDKYMPKGIMARLIVSLKDFIYDNNLVWKTGVNICNSKEKPETFAEIIEDTSRENRFDICIFGEKKPDLLNKIMYHFDTVLKPFKKLTYDKKVPCNCDTCKGKEIPYFFDYNSLLRRKEKNKQTIECDISFDDVYIDELLSGINLTELRSLLLNEKFEDFKILIRQKFANIPYLIHKNKVSEGFFHSILHTILSENGLRPNSEDGTNNGRIDAHLTIGDTKFIFELKINKTAKKALEQIDDKEYYLKFQRDFKKIIHVGMNFSTKDRNLKDIEIDTWKK